MPLRLQQLARPGPALPRAPDAGPWARLPDPPRARGESGSRGGRVGPSLTGRPPLRSRNVHKRDRADSDASCGGALLITPPTRRCASRAGDQRRDACLWQVRPVACWRSRAEGQHRSRPRSHRSRRSRPCSGACWLAVLGLCRAAGDGAAAACGWVYRALSVEVGKCDGSSLSGWLGSPARTLGSAGLLPCRTRLV